MWSAEKAPEKGAFFLTVIFNNLSIITLGPVTCRCIIQNTPTYWFKALHDAAVRASKLWVVNYFLPDNNLSSNAYILFFISITGVASSISTPLTVIIFLLIFRTTSSETAIGLGRTGLRVEKTPRLGLDVSPRGCTRKTVRSALSSQNSTTMVSPLRMPSSPARNWGEISRVPTCPDSS